MNKKELKDLLASEFDLTKGQASEYVDFVFAKIQDALVDGKEVAFNLGKFQLKRSAEREGKNPLTGKKQVFAAKTSVKFKPAKSLRDAVVNVIPAEDK